MATYSEIQAKVSRRVIDLPSQVTAEVPALVNWALLEIQRQRNFRVMQGTASYTTTAATRVLGALPSDFKEYRDQPLRVSFDGKPTGLDVVNSLADIHASYDDVSTGAPAILHPVVTSDLGAADLQVWPLPDGDSDYSDGEYRITLPYWRYLPDLSMAGDTNWFTQKAEMYLVFRATAEAFDLNHDDGNFQKYVAKANAEFLKVQRADKLEQVLAVDTMVPRWQGAMQPLVHRR